MTLHAPFDFKNPDYDAVFAQRLERLARIRAAVAEEKRMNMPPAVLPALYAYYQANPIAFINDWGVTFDPRLVAQKRRPMMPFILFPRQIDFLEWCLERWRNSERGWAPKSRDVGFSWLCVALGATMCLFNEGFVAGYGSRKEEYVDKLNSPKSLFYKARLFVKNTPFEFRGQWRLERDAPYMRISFPSTGSIMTGEAGDNIGRGDRTSMYFVDESAHLERPELNEASLSATTTCRIDVSSANGTANPFYTGLTSADPRQVFYFRWTDDPRKDQAWYDKMLNDYDAVTVAQEVDINFSASVEGIIIPAEWVESAVDACRKLGIEPSGKKRGHLDVADQGIDKNCYGQAFGVEVQRVEEWSGKGDDIFGTVSKTFGLADEDGLEGFAYDADGLGAGVRGDARVINEARALEGIRQLKVDAWRGSGEVVDPDKPIATASTSEDVQPLSTDNPRTNKNFFANYKAQSWWALRVRFQITHRAVTTGCAFDPDDIISLPPDLPGLDSLKRELSQAVWAPPTPTGKMVVNKAPSGTKSPNKADTIVGLFSPVTTRPVGLLGL